MPLIQYISTRNAQKKFSFTEAMLLGLAPDGGLFVPDMIPVLSDDIYNIFFKADDPITAGTVLLKDFFPALTENDLTDCLRESLNFPLPLIRLEDQIFLLEVFHGPTLAFKDIGARFMASILSRITQANGQSTDILVATSGDTGSAVAHGFYGIPNIRVFILYPEGRIAPLQEKQITALSKNIFPLKVAGSFDDCQRLVKTALGDTTLSAETGIRYSTANSINIARLLPQIIYHSWGIIQLKKIYQNEKPPVLCVPSGNLGNLTAALYAGARGLPIQHFIAATNKNNAFGHFLETGDNSGRPSLTTCSNAMDVGHPSNLERIQNFFNGQRDKMRSTISALSVSDEETLKTIRSVYKKHQYIVDPHTAVGIAAAYRFIDNKSPMIVTATAHPAKFPEVAEKALGKETMLPVPESLRAVMNTEKTGRKISADYKALRSILTA